jgi:hypothetical protein
MGLLETSDGRSLGSCLPEPRLFRICLKDMNAVFLAQIFYLTITRYYCNAESFIFLWFWAARYANLRGEDLQKFAFTFQQLNLTIEILS